MKKVLAILCIVLFSATAHASDEFLVFSIATYHQDRDMGDCEINPGAQLQHFTGENTFYNFGAFKNSSCHLAVNAFVGWESSGDHHFLGVPVGLGIMGGLITGYASPIMGAPYIRIGNRDAKLHADLMVVPIPNQMVFGLGVSYKLK